VELDSKIGELHDAQKLHELENMHADAVEDQITAISNESGTLQLLDRSLGLDRQVVRARGHEEVLHRQVQKAIMGHAGSERLEESREYYH
jgi:hypothetical protein